MGIEMNYITLILIVLGYLMLGFEIGYNFKFKKDKKRNQGVKQNEIKNIQGLMAADDFYKVVYGVAVKITRDPQCGDLVTFKRPNGEYETFNEAWLTPEPPSD